jgi:hypothetical protein
MKTKIIAGLLMVSAIVPAKAQIFGPNGTAGAIVGGIVGAVVGNNNGHRTWEGAAIGAGVGMIAGTIADNNQYQPRVVYSTPVYGTSTTTYYEEPAYYTYPGENVVIVRQAPPPPPRVVIVQSPVAYNVCPPVYVNRPRVVEYYSPNYHHRGNTHPTQYRNVPPPTRPVNSNHGNSNNRDVNRGRGR